LAEIRHLDLLALEFALAADIVRTAVAPTWEDITKLAVIATIRTMLNYFLAKDIASFEKGGGIGRKSPSSADFALIPLDPNDIMWLSASKALQRNTTGMPAATSGR
jgi:Protein of unknown function (DUF1622)